MSHRCLTELIRGKGAHADPLACVEDISGELASKTITGYPHSIWQIVGHLNYWTDYEIKRIAGKAPAYPAHAIESWPPSTAPADEQEWKAAVAHFAALLEQMETLAASGAKVLSRQMEASGIGQAALASTVEDILWQTMAHNSYHAGQIALLRRSLGAWPPKRGGDSW
jgi:uncharacterized damage-inducible protein DinB